MAWRMAMVAVAAVVVGAGLAGCERHDSATYDPRIDGVAPMEYASATPHILEDQNKLERIKVTDSGRIITSGGSGGGTTTGPEAPSTPVAPPDAGPAIPPPPDAE